MFILLFDKAFQNKEIVIGLESNHINSVHFYTNETDPAESVGFALDEARRLDLFSFAEFSRRYE